MKMLLADNLKLPVEFVTETAVIFGKRGSGKSSTAARLAEQLAGAGLQFAVLDVPDAWWGLKSSGDGKSPGLPVYVFGGRHADLPLESGAGAMLADVIVDHRVNVVMSLRHFSNRERTRYVADFAERLFQKNTSPLHLFCEEAHRLMPQDVRDYERGSAPELMLGRMLKLHTEGRAAGIGLTCVTQRPALLHKTATTQSELLIAHRILGPQDTEAIRGWIKHQDLDDQAGVLETLPTLKTGECWLWSPAWPDDKPIGLKRIKVLMPDTYDSRRTPKPGEQLREPKALAPVDLEKLRDKMAATIERVKAEDPKELRKQVAELKKQIVDVDAKLSTAHAEIIRLKGKKPSASVEDRDELKRLRSVVREVGKFTARIRAQEFMQPVDPAALRAAIDTAVSSVISAVEYTIKSASNRFAWTQARAAEIQATIQKLLESDGPEVVADRIPAAISSAEAEVYRPRKINTYVSDGDSTPSGIQTSTNGSLKPVQRKMLAVLAQRRGKPTNRNQVAIFSGYSSRSSHVDNVISSLRTAGYLAGSSSAMQITEQGRAVLGQYEQLPVGQKLRDYWTQEVGKAPGEMLRNLILAYPETLSRDEVAKCSGYSTESSHVDNCLSKLRTMELITGGRDALRASDDLFEE